MRRRVLAVAVVFGFLVVGNVAWATNIVTNPGFETGDLSGWTHNPSPTGGDPWEVDTFSGSGPGVPHSGSFYATEGCVGSTCMTNDAGVGSIGNWLYQDLATTASTHYDLSFWYDPFIGGPTELQAWWGSAKVFDFACGDTLQPSCASVDPGYGLITVSDLLATGSPTRLTFIGRQDPAFDGLDDVCVDAVGGTCAVSTTIPEPSSFLLMESVLPAIAGVLLGSRRRPLVARAAA